MTCLQSLVTKMKMAVAIVSACLLVSPKCFATAQTSADDYIAAIKQTLLKHWQPKRRKLLSILKTRLTLNKSGKIDSLEFLEGAQSKDCAELALLLKSTPFPPLPNDCSSMHLGISFAYDSNIKSLTISNLDERIRLVGSATGLDLQNKQFMDAVQRRIRSCWHLTHSFDYGSCVVRFSLAANGQLTELVLLKPDQNREFNRAALAAITNAAPFDIIPAGLATPVEIEFTFDNFLSDPPGDSHTAAKPGMTALTHGS